MAGLQPRAVDMHAPYRTRLPEGPPEATSLRRALESKQNIGVDIGGHTSSTRSLEATRSTSFVSQSAANLQLRAAVPMRLAGQFMITPPSLTQRSMLGSPTASPSYRPTTKSWRRQAVTHMPNRSTSAISCDSQPCGRRTNSICKRDRGLHRADRHRSRPNSPSYWARSNEQRLGVVPSNVLERLPSTALEQEPDPQTGRERDAEAASGQSLDELSVEPRNLALALLQAPPAARSGCHAPSG